MRERVQAVATRPDCADVLWLTWVQWRAFRAAGVPVLSWSEEMDLLARGHFHEAWA